MVLTKVVIEQRLAELKNGKQQTAMQIEQMKANLIATDGAIQDCEHWLKELEVEEKKED
jgi:hypothetical protein